MQATNSQLGTGSEGVLWVAPATRRLCRQLMTFLSVGAACLCTLGPAEAGRTPAPDVSFAEVGKLLDSQGDTEDEFGSSSDLDDDILIIGAPDGYGAAPGTGTATLFQRDRSGDWEEVVLLSAPDGMASDAFGGAVAVDGNWAIVGAHGSGDLGDGAGAAYVFERDTGGPDTWGFVLKLLASDGEPRDVFSFALSLSGDTLAVGAHQDDDLGSLSGSAYLFQRDAGGTNNWGQVVKLTAADGASGDRFGEALAIDGDWLVVGAPYNDDAGTTAGAAYIFQRDTGGADNWGLVTKILAADGHAGAHFGEAVAIEGETLVVGAHNDDAPKNSQGSVYLFERDFGGPNNWGQLAKLTAVDGSIGDDFGVAVEIDSGTIAVGALGDDEFGHTNAGSAYLFRRDEGGTDNWGKIAKVIASDGAAGDFFGAVLSLEGGTLAVSSPEDNDLGEDSGSVYIFDEIQVDPALVVTGICPGEVTFNFTGGTPLGQAALAFSQSQGNAVIPGGLCAGIETGLDVVNLLGILPVDSEGRVTLDATLPFFVCDLQLQVVDLVSCATSNVTTLP